MTAFSLFELNLGEIIIFGGRLHMINGEATEIGAKSVRTISGVPTKVSKVSMSVNIQSN